MQRSLLLAALLLAGAWSAAAQACDPATCVAPACACASTKAPGGLTGADIPQFVLITHDDSINQLQNRVVRAVTDGFKNPNGCNVPATWFALKDKTNCTLVQQLVKDNHEIAGHTMNHVEMSSKLTKDEMTAEVKGIKDFMVDTCGVPADKFRGFRAPYLVHNAQLRDVLAEQGYEYDSSILEPFTAGGTSPSWAERTWPYTMDSGIPQNCAWAGSAESTCAPGEKHAGLWEVPLWISPGEDGTNKWSMDITAADADKLFDLMVKNFEQVYNGNRAPFPIFLHAPWFTFDNTTAALRFMEYATQKKDVWFVTVSQLIDWMKNPVPASQYNPTCQLVELTPPVTEYCRQYKAGPIEDLWTVGGKFGIPSDDAILSINPGLNKWTIAEGTLVNLPPWDDRCEKKGAAKLASVDWYKPKYLDTPPATLAAAAAPEASAAAAPAPAPLAAIVEQLVGAAPEAAPVAPKPVDTQPVSGASAAARGAAALLAAAAALALLL